MYQSLVPKYLNYHSVPIHTPYIGVSATLLFHPLTAISPSTPGCTEPCQWNRPVGDGADELQVAGAPGALAAGMAPAEGFGEGLGRLFPQPGGGAACLRLHRGVDRQLRPQSGGQGSKIWWERWERWKWQGKRQRQGKVVDHGRPFWSFLDLAVSQLRWSYPPMYSVQTVYRETRASLVWGGFHWCFKTFTLECPCKRAMRLMQHVVIEACLLVGPT